MKKFTTNVEKFKIKFLFTLKIDINCLKVLEVLGAMLQNLKSLLKSKIVFYDRWGSLLLQQSLFRHAFTLSLISFTLYAQMNGLMVGFRVAMNIVNEFMN